MGLADILGRTLDDARRSYAAFRPEVAEYLFERGFRPVERAVPGDDTLLHAIFRLQMESIGARTFGVSNDAWRTNAGWPDRYFPILWIDLLPQLLPLLPEQRRLSTVVALFNLGENLVQVAPSLGGSLGELLLRDVRAIAESDVPSVAIAALVELGVLPPEILQGRTERRVEPTTVRALGSMSTAAWDPQFIPGAVGWVSEGTFFVVDRVRKAALQLTRAGTTFQLVARSEVAPRAEDGGNFAMSDTGDVTFGGRSIGRIDPRGVFASAISPSGLIVIARQFSQTIELWGAA